MTVAILDVRPTLESGVEPCLSGARDFVPVLEPRTPDRRQLLCHWRRDPDGRLVGIWESALVCSGALVRRSAFAPRARDRMPREPISQTENEQCCFTSKGATEILGTLSGYGRSLA